MYHNLIGTHRQSLVNRHQCSYRRFSTNRERNNRKSTAVSTPNSINGYSTTCSSGQDTATEAQVGNRRTTSIMPKSWSTSFIKSSRGSHDDWEQQGLGIRGEGSVECFILFLVYWVPAQYKWHWHRFHHLLIAVTWRWTYPVRRIHRIVTNYEANPQREIGGWRTL